MIRAGDYEYFRQERAVFGKPFTKREHLDNFARDAMHNLLVPDNPRPIHRVEDVSEVLEMAF